MNKDQKSGTAQNLKGRIEQAVGALSGNKRTEASGATDRAIGAGKKAAGDVKRAVSKNLDR